MFTHMHPFENPVPLGSRSSSVQYTKDRRVLDHSCNADYVVVDGTNIDTYDPTADSLQLRPLQVLFEVWSA